MKPSQYKSLLRKRQQKGIAKAVRRRIRVLPIFGRNTLTKGQEAALDTLWSEAVKARAGFKCENCLRSGIRLESHHFYGRRNKAVRHVVSNGFSLCHAHHRMAEEQPAKFIEWAIKSRGQAWYDDLEVQSRQVKSFREYIIVKAYLTSFL